MIYVTGDIHADRERFSQKGAKVLKKNDTLLVCGDFGFVWSGDAREQRLLRWIGRRRYNTLFVEGTHDNLDLLKNYPITEYGGAPARQISGRCYQLLRGEVYHLEGMKVFTFGGGESADMDVRTEGETWWREELPSQEELDHARETLQKYGNRVDYIITHTPSASMHGFLNMDSLRTDHLGAFLDEVSANVKYRHWYFGRYHLDKVIPPNHHAIYQAILPLAGKL